MNEKLTPQAQEALRQAEAAAKTYNHSYVGTEHLLLGLLREKDGTAGKVLEDGLLRALEDLGVL